MSKQIYNEGRVVGLSQYEIFVKNWLSNTATKDIDPPSEQEWLASTVGPGNSLLLKMFPDESHRDDEVWIYETHLPEGTNLCGCNPVIASLFIGDGAPTGDTEVWPKYVNSYGDTVTNKTKQNLGSVLDPTLENLPYDTDLPNYGTINTVIEQYSKIVDGTILQGGTWELNTEKGVYDFKPDLSSNSKSMIRMQIKGKITQKFYILLTGLNYKSTIQGVSGLDGSIDKSGSQNGAYLGPAQYPWACKVLFTLPASYATFNKIAPQVYVKYGSSQEDLSEAKKLAASLRQSGLVIYKDTYTNENSIYFIIYDNETDENGDAKDPSQPGSYIAVNSTAVIESGSIYIGSVYGTHFNSPTVSGIKMTSSYGEPFFTFSLPTIDKDGLVPGFPLDVQNSRDVDYIKWSDLAQAMHDYIYNYTETTYNSEEEWKTAIQSDNKVYIWSDIYGIYTALRISNDGKVIDSSGNEITFGKNQYYTQSKTYDQLKLDVLGESLRQAKQSLTEDSPYINFNGTRLYVSSEAPVDSFYYQILSTEEAPSDWFTVKISDNKYFALKADGKYVPVGIVEGETINHVQYKPNTYYEKITDNIPDGSIGIGW